MALLDLSLVTESLVKLVDESIKASPAWPSGQVPNVTSLPPDRLDGDNTVGLYLYHLTEDAALKNQVWSGRPTSPIRFSPMGLNLYFVLSAFSGLADSLGPYREQLMMGLSVKALRDWPVIDDSTVINGISILHPNLRDANNRIRVELRHVPVTEAVSFWSAGSHALRLSAYYEARIILLEPDEPVTSGARVLRYGLQVFVAGRPQLETSRSVVTFHVPGEATDRVVELQPAVVEPGGEVAFYGLNLSGDVVGLLVRAPSWTAAVSPDPAWGVVASSDRIYTTVQTTLDGRTILPGSYVAAARVVRTIAQADGTTRPIEQTSNETPFTIAPAVTAIGAPINGVFDVTGATFQDPDLSPDAVVVYLGGARLTTGTAGSLAPGELAITSPTTLQLRFPADAVAGAFLSVRIIVNGAESLPRWIEVS